MLLFYTICVIRVNHIVEIIGRKNKQVFLEIQERYTKLYNISQDLTKLSKLYQPLQHFLQDFTTQVFETIYNTLRKLCVKKQIPAKLFTKKLNLRNFT